MERMPTPTHLAVDRDLVRVAALRQYVLELLWVSFVLKIHVVCISQIRTKDIVESRVLHDLHRDSKRKHTRAQMGALTCGWNWE